MEFLFDIIWNMFLLKSPEWIINVFTNIYVNGMLFAAVASNNINEFVVVKNWNTSNYKLNSVYSTLTFMKIQ
jgi:hypothetical protein